MEKWRQCWKTTHLAYQGVREIWSGPKCRFGRQDKGERKASFINQSWTPQYIKQEKKQQNRVTDTKQETRDKTKYNKEAKFKSNIEKNEKSKSKLGDWRQKRKHKELKEGGDW